MHNERLRPDTRISAVLADVDGTLVTKDKVLTEDDCKSVKNDVQELTKKFENSAASMASAREAEVMEN